MRKLSVKEIIALIKSKTTFEAVADDYSFRLKIENYVPYLCGAVHDGHQFRQSLWDHCLHSEYERWYEEDPCTHQMVHNQPIVITGCDSRFEYDLNRPPETAIFDTAWGKQLWKEPLSKKEKSASLNKHGAFYQVVHALVDQLEKMHGTVIVFDIHSYNWKRWDRPVPTWNLGTVNVDNQRFGTIISAWSTKLGTMRLGEGIPQTSLINDTFQGNGYFLKYITQNFDNTLVLATEIAKVYCDELSGIIYPEIVRSVQLHLKDLIPLQVKEFQERIV